MNVENKKAQNFLLTFFEIETSKKMSQDWRSKVSIQISGWNSNCKEF